MQSSWRNQFIFLKNQFGCVYLDSAGTSLKPDVVIKRINDYYSCFSVNSHSETDHPIFQEVDNTKTKTRALLAAKINGFEDGVVFLPSATYAFNLISLACQKFIKKGDEIALTSLEHSSNFYPWEDLALKTGANLVFLPLNKTGTIDFEKAKNFISKRTKIISFFHVSNSLGSRNDPEKLIKLFKKINPDCLVILDSCQSVLEDIDVKQWKVDILVISAHKFYGPTGLGIMWVEKNFFFLFSNILWGGGKRISPLMKLVDKDFSQDFLWEHLEVGTDPLAQIFGFNASLEWQNSLEKERRRTFVFNLRNTCQGLLKKELGKFIEIYNEKIEKTSILMFNIKGVPSHDVSYFLSQENIVVRSGDFCCPMLKEIIKKSSAVRVSFGIYNDFSDIEKLVISLKKLILLWEKNIKNKKKIIG